MSNAIETVALTRVFDDFKAVDDLNLVVERGTFFGFLGPNGAGKSTTIKMLTGLAEISSGDARILGRDIVSQSVEVKKRMLGVMLNEGVDLEEFSSIRLNWGIIQYPEGASYEQGVLNEALMVIVFFGYDKISSGHFAIPNAPYFIGFFIRYIVSMT